MTPCRRRVRLLQTVWGEIPQPPGQEQIHVCKGDVCDAVENRHGAVSAVLANGELLGLKPGEFEWVEEVG